MTRKNKIVLLEAIKEVLKKVCLVSVHDIEKDRSLHAIFYDGRRICFPGLMINVEEGDLNLWGAARLEFPLDALDIISEKILIAIGG